MKRNDGGGECVERKNKKVQRNIRDGIREKKRVTEEGRKCLKVNDKNSTTKIKDYTAFLVCFMSSMSCC